MPQTDPNLCPRCIELETKVTSLEAKIQELRTVILRQKLTPRKISGSEALERPVSPWFGLFLLSYLLVFLWVISVILTPAGAAFIYGNLCVLFLLPPLLILSFLMLCHQVNAVHIGVLIVFLLLTWSWLRLLIFAVLQQI